MPPKDWSLKKTNYINPNDYLLDDKKPSENQVAWVFANLLKALESNSTYRNLIYDQMEFGPESYSSLMGGLAILNLFQEKNEKKN